MSKNHKTYRGVFKNFSFLGGNRQLSMINVFITSLLSFMSADIRLSLMAVLTGILCQLLLSKMFYADPLFHRVLLKRLQYRSVYRAQAHYFSKKITKKY
ncbi:MAG: VirB3 family type IV secretion system protein [Succinivibrio sp.]|jgi:type IV secretory pathway TrbD component|nr:VirB3 family type IV secretion system protein [Succinivibrio sp.]MBR1611952.1 VirB3 family type IV secretion system protein [Succinivibrio sp.]